MTAIDVLSAAASVSGLAMGLSPGLQARRILRRRSSADIASAAQAVVCLGATIWLCWGIALGLVPVIITNAVGAMTSGATLALARRYRRHGAR